MCIRDRADTASVKPMMNYLECGIDTHRLSSRAAAIRSMKRKFDIKMNTACYEAECKFKQTMDEVKRKNRQDPYVNSSWARNVMRKGRRIKFAERLKKIVSATNTERRYQALEIRFLKNQENKILSAYVNNGSMTGKRCSRRGYEILPTHPHEGSGKQVWKRRRKQFRACRPREGYRKGRCDISFTHSKSERKRHVINLGGVEYETHCNSITGTADRLKSEGVTQATRSNTLTVYKQNACVSNGTKSTRHATMSPQIGS